MSLTIGDIFTLEHRIRMEAQRLRFRWPESLLMDPSVEPDVKIHARNKRAFADDLDQVGNLLCGMQADWPTIGPALRRGYLAMQLPERSDANPETEPS